LTKFGWIKLKLWILQTLFAFKLEILKRFPGKPVYTEDPGFILNQSTHFYPYATIPLSHWQFKPLPWPFLLPWCPSPNANSTRGKKQGSAAYRRWERAGEGWGWLLEVLAVTARYGSTAVVAGIDRSTCAGGWSRRRRVFQLNHDDLVQLNGTMSSTGWRRGDVHKESKNGAEIYPVYVHRWSGVVRRPWTGFSGEAKSNSLLREFHRGMHGLFQGSGVVGKGSVGRSTVAGAWVAVTPRIFAVEFFLFFTRQNSGVTFSFSFCPR
jgi:hypothetical protein